MKHSLLLSFLFSLLCLPLAAQPDAREAAQRTLKMLDETVKNKDQFRQAHTERVNHLKHEAARAKGADRISRYKQIVSAYAHTQIDSAQVYLDHMAALIQPSDTALRTYCHVAQAEIYAVAGEYSLAEQEFHNINRPYLEHSDAELRLFYYRINRMLYGWMADYSENTHLDKLYHAKVAAYRDSIIQLQTPSEGQKYVLADRALENGNPREAIRLLAPLVPEKHPQEASPYCCYILAKAYEALDSTDRAIYYLALTSIADLHNGVAEYQAILDLSQMLNAMGDTERAYTYLTCAIEDANYCKARLRSIEASAFFPIVDKAHKAQQAEKRMWEVAGVAMLVLVLIILVASVLLLRKQMQRVTKAKALIDKQNEQLNKTYAHLRQTDRVKEEYIGRYLNRCRTYIDKHELYRRTLLKMVKEREYDKLYKELKSEAWVAQEQNDFFADFDSVFLTLFPDFIERFNAFLRPEERIVLRRPGQLNTELRIFALIRLGVNDATQISHFLNCSLATAYNYRSKARRKTLPEVKDLEEAVMNI